MTGQTGKQIRAILYSNPMRPSETRVFGRVGWTSFVTSEGPVKVCEQKNVGYFGYLFFGGEFGSIYQNP